MSAGAKKRQRQDKRIKFGGLRRVNNVSGIAVSISASHQAYQLHYKRPELITIENHSLTPVMASGSSWLLKLLLGNIAFSQKIQDLHQPFLYIFHHQNLLLKLRI